jgi:hypothetical protein
MSDKFTRLQHEVQNMIHLPNFNSEMIIKCILKDEDALIRRRQELGLPANPNGHVPLSAPSAFAAQTRTRPRLVCSNCNRESHAMDFCIYLGGKMAGCTIEEARAAYKASLRLAKTLRPLPSSLPQSLRSTPSTHITTTTPSPSVPSSFTSTSSPNPSIILNGRRYIPDPSWFTTSSSPCPLHSLRK